MSVKVIFEDDNWVEYEFEQPNDLMGDTYYWDDNDWMKWNEKMKQLEESGTKGNIETFKIKLKKNPLLDGQQYLGRVHGEDSTSGDSVKISTFKKSGTQGDEI